MNDMIPPNPQPPESNQPQGVPPMPKDNPFFDMAACLNHLLPYEEMDEPTKSIYLSTLNAFDDLYYTIYPVARRSYDILSLFETPVPTIGTAAKIIDELIALKPHIAHILYLIHSIIALSPVITNLIKSSEQPNIPTPPASTNSPETTQGV